MSTLSHLIHPSITHLVRFLLPYTKCRCHINKPQCFWLSYFPSNCPSTTTSLSFLRTPTTTNWTALPSTTMSPRYLLLLLSILLLLIPSDGASVYVPQNKTARNPRTHAGSSSLPRRIVLDFVEQWVVVEQEQDNHHNHHHQHHHHVAAHNHDHHHHHRGALRRPNLGWTIGTFTGKESFEWVGKTRRLQDEKAQPQERDEQGQERGTRDKRAWRCIITCLNLNTNLNHSFTLDIPG